MRFFLKSFFLFFLFSCRSQVAHQGVKINQNEVESIVKDTSKSELILGATRISAYLPLLKGKKIGVVANQTSVIHGRHLVDTLLALGIEVSAVFSPEHGFRGDADAGEKVESGKDMKTGLPLISLYGKNKKPSAEQLKGMEVILFDIQDVGVRFYTYISTLHYVMEAAAESNLSVIVLDRPNPNGHYVDGPVLKKGFESFVGMHPIPIVHGMTIGEYAQMINGEKWLVNQVECDLTVIPSLNYSRYEHYSLPIPPSPNLRSDAAIALYPSLCLFEGTTLSEGRGTSTPFEVFGHPNLPTDQYPFSFTPVSSHGAKHPKFQNELCYGLNLHEIGVNRLHELNISWIMQAYYDLPDQSFFIIKNRWFDLLAGSDELRKSIVAGKSKKEIRASWQEDIAAFKLIRRNYLIYEE